MISLNAPKSNSFSPVAIGTGLRWLICASASTEPTLQGSSMNSGRASATMSAKAIASSGLGLPWQSSISSIDGPTVLVDLHPVGAAAAGQLLDRAPPGLGGQVVQRHVDPRERRAEHRPAV